MEELRAGMKVSKIPKCIEFEDLPPGKQYNVTQSFTTSNVTVDVREFQWLGSTWTTQGYARVDKRQLAGGKGKDLWANNVNLAFRSQFPMIRLTLLCGEYGGNFNLVINGKLVNSQDLTTLNGQNIGNVLVTVTTGANPHHRKITLDGFMDRFAFNKKGVYTFIIGGQELWVDTLCPKFREGRT